MTQFVDWLPAIVTGIFLAGCCLVNWDNRRKEESAINVLREANEKYRAAIHEREEAYRVLSHCTVSNCDSRLPEDEDED